MTRTDTAVMRPVNVISVRPLDCCLQYFSVFPFFGFSYDTAFLKHYCFVVETRGVTFRQAFSRYIATQCLGFLTEIVAEIEGRSTSGR